MYKIGKNLKNNEKIEINYETIRKKFETFLVVWQTLSVFIIYRFIFDVLYFIIFYYSMKIIDNI